MEEMLSYIPFVSALLVSQIYVLSVDSYDLQCPSQPNWKFRAEVKCNSTSKYFCLFNKVNSTYVEGCNGPDWDRKGSKRIFVGDFSRGNCKKTRFQPTKFWTNESMSDCIYVKSNCSDDGQIVYMDNSTKNDRRCRCDNKKNYSFIKTPRNGCYCIPTEEDCSCYIKTCPVNFTLSEDGEDLMVDTKAANMSKEEQNARRNKKRHLLFNFSALCLIWLFSFTAYSGLINLEATLHADTGLLSLFAITFGGVIACTFAPTVIARLGPKGSLILACLFQTVYVIANYYPKAYILISGGAISGLASGLMWTVQGCYITSIAVDYLRFDLSHTSLGSVLSKLSGIFYMAFQSTQIFGNLISSVVFQFGETTLKFTNNSFCGAKFCPSDMNIHVPMNYSQNTTTETTHVDAGNHGSVNVLISIYLACTVVALLICIFGLRPIESSMSEKYETFKERFASSFGLLFKDLKVLLVVPLYFYIGMQLIVMFVEFTRSFTACRLGVGWIGYTMLCFGAADTVGSLVFGYIGKYTGRIPLFMLATLLELGLLAFMMLWDITNDTSVIFFFLIPLAWGLCDSIWMTQSMALVGSAFHKNPEPTFALCIAFQALGSAVAYIYNIYICEYLKIYIVSITLVISVFLVLILEIRIRRADKIRKSQGKPENVNSVKESLLEQKIPHIYPVDKA